MLTPTLEPARKNPRLIMEILNEFSMLIKAIDRAQVPFAICGGIALAIHGFPPFTW
jgi:hypothetical protein